MGSAAEWKTHIWLNGMAGTGKSTISRTIAGRLKAKGLLAASFFFKRGEEDRGSAKRLFSTLAKQLATRIPQFIPSIRKTVDDDPDISEKAVKDQFDKLILQPLREMKQSKMSYMVIVIDALDECEREDEIKALLRMLPQVENSQSLQLRLFLNKQT
ncbi:hypothetical protein VTN49DRAFT_7975 [Thermomyces lanuginosus]|uniref:uncharacterized protein n=1 Tax=Thermomyces lanuginosus TaxID=5541 RepID=UPI003743A1DF